MHTIYACPLSYIVDVYGGSVYMQLLCTHMSICSDVIYLFCISLDCNLVLKQNLSANIFVVGASLYASLYA